MFQFSGLSDVTRKTLNATKWDKTLSFDEMPRLERVETTQSNSNNQATESEMIFHYLTFSKNKLMKNAFQFLISWQAHI